MRLIVTAVLGCTLTALACGGSPNGPSGSVGTFNLIMKDNPFEDAKAVLVTFSEVTAHRETDPESDFTKLPFAGGTSRTCDLKKLETAQDILGVGMLPEGKYTQVRLLVSSATLYFDNPSTGEPCAATIAEPAGLNKAPLEIPSGVVKLIHPFTIAAGGATTMLIDFDGGLSIHETGNGKFMMRPVVKVVEVK